MITLTKSETDILEKRNPGRDWYTHQFSRAWKNTMSVPTPNSYLQLEGIRVEDSKDAEPQPWQVVSVQKYKLGSMINAKSATMAANRAVEEGFRSTADWLNNWKKLYSDNRSTDPDTEIYSVRLRSRSLAEFERDTR